MYNRHPGQNLPKHGSTPPCPKVGGLSTSTWEGGQQHPSSTNLRMSCYGHFVRSCIEGHQMRKQKAGSISDGDNPMSVAWKDLSRETVVGCRLKSRMFSRGWRMRISAADKKGPVVSHRALLGSLAAYVEMEIKEQSPHVKT